MNELYNRIEDKAREKGMSICALCDRAGVYRSRVTDLKSGRVKTMSTSIIRKLANVLGTTPEALLYGEDDKRIFHVDLDSKRPNYQVMCAGMETEELLDLLNALTSELNRRRTIGK